MQDQVALSMVSARPHERVYRVLLCSPRLMSTLRPRAGAQAKTTEELQLEKVTPATKQAKSVSLLALQL